MTSLWETMAMLVVVALSMAAGWLLCTLQTPCDPQATPALCHQLGGALDQEPDGSTVCVFRATEEN